jgi:hypothetical protein
MANGKSTADADLLNLLADAGSLAISELEKRRVRSEVDTLIGGHAYARRDRFYSELTDVDNTICEMETMLFSQLLGDEVVLSQYRLDGHACCQFGPNQKRTTRKAQVTV